MADSHIAPVLKRQLRWIAHAFYDLLFLMVSVCLLSGVWATVNINTDSDAALQSFGAAAHKYPFTQRYVMYAAKDTELRKQGFYEGPILKLNHCDAAQFASLKALLSCAKIETTEKMIVETLLSGQPSVFEAQRLSVPLTYQYELFFFSLDSLLCLVSLSLSLLLFIKCRRFLSGYLISLALLLIAGECRFFYIGSMIFDADRVEAIRLGALFIIGPLAMFFFPQAFRTDFWKSPQFVAIVFAIVLMQGTFHLVSFGIFVYSVSFCLLVLLIHFITKYRRTLSTKEKKQVLTMVYCVTLGLAMYLPLMQFGGWYGFLIGRYLIVISVGIGIMFALMRYGLWQVDTLISKSATLSLLSIIAFSAWAGLDQGMQALLNQTIGLSNKTFTAFLAAAISSFFAVPAYNYVSKSCDAFFNKDLHQLKRLLSKDILVLAEVQTLEVFVAHLGNKLRQLSGAQHLTLEFIDYGHLEAPCVFEAKRETPADNDAFIRTEHFDYQIEQVLSVSIVLAFADRRINREFKHELEEGTDEIARALASCARWNYLESTRQPHLSRRPQPGEAV